MLGWMDRCTQNLFKVFFLQMENAQKLSVSEHLVFPKLLKPDDWCSLSIWFFQIYTQNPVLSQGEIKNQFGAHQSLHNRDSPNHTWLPMSGLRI
jgi:hypothetical protein